MHAKFVQMANIIADYIKIVNNVQFINISMKLKDIVIIVYCLAILVKV